MVNPKKNPLMGFEVTEGSQKKAKMDKTALTASPLLWWPERAAWEKPFLLVAAEGTRPRTRWCGRQSPVPPWDQAALAKKHLCVCFLPCCITWYPTPPREIRLAKAFQLCERTWGKKIIITEVFIFSGKGAKVELPKQEISLCSVVMTEAEGQTNLRCWGYPPCRRSVPTTWFQAKKPQKQQIKSIL